MRKRINHAGQTGGKDSRRETIPPPSGGSKKTQPREPERKRDPDRLRRKSARINKCVSYIAASKREAHSQNNGSLDPMPAPQRASWQRRHQRPTTIIIAVAEARRNPARAARLAVQRWRKRERDRVTLSFPPCRRRRRGIPGTAAAIRVDVRERRGVVLPAHA